MPIDDEKLRAVWQKCGELKLTVAIHTADPAAFFLAHDASNPRAEELRSHADWWFGDFAKYPAREELLAALDRVVAQHPQTTFIALHFGNNAEDLAWVD